MRIIALLCSVLSFTLAGCMGPVMLHEAVLSYDETISHLEREILLLNIARTHRNIPSHFTVTSSIAATFDYRTSVGFFGAILGSAPNEYVLTWV